MFHLSDHSSGADVIPAYFFGNTAVLSVLASGPLAALFRVSVTLTWGLWGLPIPKPVKLVYGHDQARPDPARPDPTR